MASRTRPEIIRRPSVYRDSALKSKESLMKKVARKYYLNESANVTKTSLKTKEASAKVNEETVIKAPTMDATSEGHYELSPLLSRMVEAELQEVMKKVWELQPLNPKDDAERLVSDRFRKKAGQDLRNTLGLNITKRLLNIHNPLYVKMVFAGKPLRVDLLAFLKKNNICAFKRVGERGGTFAAKMRTFQEFDNLCTDKNLKCGNIRVTVTPCYQFMTCPPNLRTSYSGKETKNNNEIASNKPSQQETQNKNKATENVSNVQQNAANRLYITPKKTPVPTNEANITAVKQPTPNSQIKQGTVNKVAEKITPVKTTESPVQTVVIKPVSKAADAKPTQLQKTIPKETPKKVDTPNTTPTVTPIKQAAKVLPKKPATSSTKPAVTNEKAPAKVIPAKTEVIKLATNQAKNSAPKTTVSNVKPPITQAQNVTTTNAKPLTTQVQSSVPKVITAIAKPAISQSIQAQSSAQKVAPSNAKPANTQGQNSIPIVTPVKSVAQKNSTTPKIIPKENTAANVAQKNSTTPKVIPKQNTAANFAQKISTTPKVVPKQNTAANLAQKISTTPKVVPKQNTAANVTPTNKVTPKKANVIPKTPQTKQVTTVKTKATPAKVQNKPTLASKATISPKKKLNDFDELDDHDILALISEGIVLDECSGSDIE